MQKKTTHLFAIVFLNGLAIMVLEMVGARLLAPWLGTSITVWTSLIGVILAAMSLGYFLGGSLADRLLLVPEAAKKKDASVASQRCYQRASKVLSGLLVLAAISVLFTAFIQSLVLAVLSQGGIPLHLAAIIAALVLFALPGLLCGMVSPFTMRLALQDTQNAGKIIGRMNAVGTIGSIIGTFLGGFILISWFGSKEILFGIAACLLFTACLSSLTPVVPKVVIAGLILAGLGLTHVLPSTENGYLVETAYNTMRVLEGDLQGRPVRFLVTDQSVCQSGTYLDTPDELVFAYTQHLRLGPALVPDATRLLMLGGGGYSVPKWLLSSQGPFNHPFKLDVVELDPGMTEVAHKDFYLPKEDARLRIFHNDARVFLNNAAQTAKNDERYQIIFLDTFHSYCSVPFHMGTQESAKNMHDLLDDNGVVLMNIIGAIEGDNGQLVRSIYHAFAAEFAQVSLHPVKSDNGNEVQNILLMAFRTERTLSPEELSRLAPDLRLAYEQKWEKTIPTDVPALVDNYAPVERYTLGLMNATRMN